MPATKKQPTSTQRKPAARSKQADGEKEILDKLASWQPKDRTTGKRLHAIIKENAPDLTPRTWYGMPAYAKEGKVVLFFRDRAKFKEPYMTLGFNSAANLDDGSMWPIVFALVALDDKIEAKIAKLVKKAVS
jgi:uncharacterized protein YdhG (YjbR/CyaY superfamily)